MRAQTLTPPNFWTRSTLQESLHVLHPLLYYKTQGTHCSGRALVYLADALGRRRIQILGNRVPIIKNVSKDTAPCGLWNAFVANAMMAWQQTYHYPNRSVQHHTFRLYGIADTHPKFLFCFPDWTLPAPSIILLLVGQLFQKSVSAHGSCRCQMVSSVFSGARKNNGTAEPAV